MLLRPRSLSGLFLASLLTLQLGACTLQEKTPEESIQASADEPLSGMAQAPSDAELPTEPSEKDQALAEAASSDFTDPSDAQLDGKSEAATAPSLPRADELESAALADSPVPPAVSEIPDITAEQGLDSPSAEAVYFGKNSARLSKEQRRLLKDVAARLKADRSAKVTLSGHCDNRGSASYNRRLANKRAKAVKSALVKMGVKGKQIQIGAAQLAQSGDSEQQHSQNRRVEFSFH